MKTLVLVRHAKSDWGDASLPDHDRPLNERGRRDAPEMGRRLASHGLRPDIILASTALRARTTAEAFAAELGLAPEQLVLEPRLYGSSPRTMLDLVAALDDDLTTAMVVAHDPGMSELAAQLSAGTDAEIDRMPTCAVAEFTFAATSWADLRSETPDSVVFSRP